MSSRKPAFLIVHGAFHVPAHFDRLATLIQNDGYRVVVPALPSVGVTKDQGNATSLDAAAVRQALETLTCEADAVVVLMHSYGGQCGSEAIAAYLSDTSHPSSTDPTKPGHKIARLVYIGATLLRQGDNFTDEHTPARDPEASKYPVDISDAGVMTYPFARERYYSPTTAAEDAEHAVSLLQGQAASIGSERAAYGAYAWARYGVPVTWIGTRQDRALPVGMQEEYVQRLREAGVETEVVWWECDHSPYLTYARDVKAVLVAAAAKSLRRDQ